MTQEETKRVLAILKAAYPSSYNNMTKREAIGTVAVWNMQFSDMPVEIVLMAVQKAISTNKFPPSISEVKEKIESIHWEAYEALSNCSLTASDDAKKKYQWIYDATKRFKMAKAAEPSLYQMLSGGQMLQISDGQDGQ